MNWKLIKIIDINTWVWGIKSRIYVWQLNDGTYQTTNLPFGLLSNAGYGDFNAMMNLKFGENWESRVIKIQEVNKD